MPEEYPPEVRQRVLEMVDRGLSDREIARRERLHHDTVRRWRRTEEERPIRVDLSEQDQVEELGKAITVIDANAVTNRRRYNAEVLANSREDAYDVLQSMLTKAKDKDSGMADYVKVRVVELGLRYTDHLGFLGDPPLEGGDDDRAAAVKELFDGLRVSGDSRSE